MQTLRFPSVCVPLFIWFTVDFSVLPLDEDSLLLCPSLWIHPCRWLSLEPGSNRHLSTFSFPLQLWFICFLLRWQSCNPSSLKQAIGEESDSLHVLSPTLDQLNNSLLPQERATPSSPTTPYITQCEVHLLLVPVFDMSLYLQVSVQARWIQTMIYKTWCMSIAHYGVSSSSLAQISEQPGTRIGHGWSKNAFSCEVVFLLSLLSYPLPPSFKKGAHSFQNHNKVQVRKSLKKCSCPNPWSKKGFEIRSDSWSLVLQIWLISPRMETLQTFWVTYFSIWISVGSKEILATEIHPSFL